MNKRRREETVQNSFLVQRPNLPTLPVSVENRIEEYADMPVFDFVKASRKLKHDRERMGDLSDTYRVLKMFKKVPLEDKRATIRLAASKDKDMEIMNEKMKRSKMSDPERPDVVDITQQFKRTKMS